MLVLAVLILVLQPSDSDGTLNSSTKYVYDVENGELSKGSIKNVPAATPSDSFAWANAFSCCECTKDELFVGYLEQFDGELRQRLAMAETSQMASSMIAQYQGPPEDHMIKRPGDAVWVPYDSPQGQAIRNEVMNECGGDRPKPCAP